ncbi:MAG: four helix bundle protein [Bacteroidetes bacterium]|nr:four helix bundle protein [Bacteroidota bacterium]
MKAKYNNFQDLIMWQKAHEFVLEVYKTTSKFPQSEQYGLTSQFRRAAVSVAANIAEGYKRKTKIDKGRFYLLSQSSLEECRYYIILSRDLGYHANESLQPILENVSMLIESYNHKLLESGN